jgi:regulator of protease activity HflC (stomatin/prohibitin superfamily)
MVVRRVIIIAGVLIVLGALTWGYRWSRSEWIEPGHVGVMYSARSGLEQRVYTPRRLYVPWFHQLYTYPTLTQAAIYTQDTAQGEDRSADGIQVTTSDNAMTTFDVVVYYRVRPEDVFTVFKEFGAIPIDTIQRVHIRRAVKDACQAVGTQSDAFSLMGKNRETAAARLTSELQQRLQPKGITVEMAYFCQAYPQEALMQKINQRVNAYTQLTIATIDQQIANVESQAALVKSRAETRAAAIKASQTQARSLELLQLETDKQALERWNGQLPPIQAKPGQTLVIPNGLISALQTATPEKPSAPARAQEQSPSTEGGGQ